MKIILKIIILILFTFLIYASEPTIDLLKGIENNLTCTQQYAKTEKIEECIKKILEMKINEQDKYKVQLGVFSNKTGAIEVKNKYNKWKNKIPSLKKSQADYFLKKIKKKKKYYVVFVFQKGTNAKELRKKIIKYDKEKKFEKPIISDSKVVIDINNKIIKNIGKNRVKILYEKNKCYQKNKDNGLKLMECLKKESINGVQFGAFYDERLCKNKADDISKKVKSNHLEAVCIKKTVNKELYSSVIVLVESNKSNNIKKNSSDAFFIEKPEILIK